MKELHYTITDEQGIHARPAGLLVKEATAFASDITISCKEKNGDAKRIFSVMALGAKKGDTIVLQAKGSDEADAIDALGRFLSAHL